MESGISNVFVFVTLCCNVIRMLYYIFNVKNSQNVILNVYQLKDQKHRRINSKWPHWALFNTVNSNTILLSLCHLGFNFTKNEILNKLMLMLEVFFVGCNKRKPKLTFCIHGSWIVPPNIEIIDDENSRKTTDSMKIQFLIWYSDWLKVPWNYFSFINSY
jgi:hypothetical protein